MEPGKGEQEVSEPVNQSSTAQTRRPYEGTRRWFLKLFGGTAAGAAAGVALGFKMDSQRQVFVQAAAGPTLTPTNSPAAVPSKPPVTAEPTSVEILKPTPYNALYENCNPKEKEQAREMVEEEKRKYDAAYTENKPAFDKRVTQSSKYTEEIKTAARLLGFKADSYVPKLLPALIFVESEGIPTVSNSSGAKGLCQLMPATALNMYARLQRRYEETKNEGLKQAIDKINKTGINPFDSFTNIALALEYFDSLSQYIPDMGLMFLAYHIGNGNLIKLVNAEMGQAPAFANEMIKNLRVYEKAQGVLDTIGSNISSERLNVVRMANSEMERKKTNMEFLNDGAINYTAQIGAASLLLAA